MHLLLWNQQKSFSVQQLIREYEMQWIGDFNPKMINMAETLAIHFAAEHLLLTDIYLTGRKNLKDHPVLS